MTDRDTPADALAAALRHRFGDDFSVDPALPGLAALARQAEHRSHRRFTARPVDASLLRLLSAVALCAPTKSDLQQRDVIIVEDAEQRRRLLELVPDNEWAASAPALLVFCGNNRRQRQLHAWRGRPFANDHLDALFNAAVDAGIALAAFVVAAETVGLGCCPISAIRNHARPVSDTLALPDHVFPVAGLGVGWPADAGTMSLRLPLSVTVHRDRFADDDVRAQTEAYDRRRAAVQPYARQRYAEAYGTAREYGWSEDKARQYSKPERADFGAFLRMKGFQLT
jgi:nitroreductase/FMN reductase [NAD(P)H]